MTEAEIRLLLDYLVWLSLKISMPPNMFFALENATSSIAVLRCTASRERAARAREPARSNSGSTGAALSSDRNFANFFLEIHMMDNGSAFLQGTRGPIPVFLLLFACRVCVLHLDTNTFFIYTSTIENMLCTF